MPGTRRSTGCLLCVQRRVKCDEKLPGCTRCETYGRKCPGYDRGFKFVTAKPYRTPRRPKPRNSLPENATTSLTCMRSTELNVMQSLDVLIDDLMSPFPASATYSMAQWFSFLPVAYGRNKTLDATVRCFVAHHLGGLGKNVQAVRYARFAYGEALGRLQMSLNNPTESVATEVLCAVLLQCFYELFTNTDDSVSWMKHAKGLGQLIKHRGSARHHDEFDCSLLKASRGLIIMHSVFSGEECFLASEDWHSAMRQQFNTCRPPEIYDQVEELFVSFTAIPRLIHQMFELKQADMTSPATQDKVSSTVAETLVMHASLTAWYDRFIQVVLPPSEVPSSTGDALFPTVFSFSSIDAASIFCGYYSFMVVVHEVLHTCGCPGNQLAHVVYFRDQICKSVEYTSRGLLGPSRLGFPLRVAYEVADPVTRSWIEGWLLTLSKRYAAVLPKNFQ
ncbi:hypothetical protein FE257_004612 [Aspergillus nanangensis]|uniref:Zn(2)-C6 fungal-type domain-containing protein n=1 Tax=Aspergillus nanangensis TaxID=2582783 RepID=A0AAD4H0R4_ASPNN|nr:hypothetical protein FE257_004612 [Aspergillus nanangensis]